MLCRGAKGVAAGTFYGGCGREWGVRRASSRGLVISAGEATFRLTGQGYLYG